MSRPLLLILVLLVCGQPTAVAQSGRSDVTELLRQLLAKPVPRPQSETLAAETDKPRRPRSFYDDDNPPADDAPLDDLLDYWTGRAHGRLTDKVRQRLFEGSLADPERLSALIGLVPKNTETATKIKQLYDTAQSDQKFDQHWHQEIKKWLIFNSNYFVNELLGRVQKVKVNKYGTVENTDALVALAKVDWDTAEPLLRNFANSGQPRQAALALTLFYHHSMAEKDSAAAERYRNSLKAISSDRNQPGWARYYAIETLSSTEWSDRDEWYLSLFQDETVLELRDGQNAFSPLTALFATDPEKWIPIMARLTESKDLAIRSGAASCLITFQNQRARKDALLPLLPWLSNPGWAKDQSNNRLRLVQSMQNVDLPESVPGLIWAVENDEHGSTRSYAAQSLARYCDPRAVPALKKALNHEKEEDDIVGIIQGLIPCQGFTEQEQVEALEAYALKTLTPEGIEALEPYRRSGLPPLPIPLLIGRTLVNQEATNDALVRAVLQRAEAFKESNPPLAQALLRIAHKWTGRQVDLDMINRIGNGSANAETIVQAFERRSQLRESLELELRGLLAADGPAQGIAAILLGDSSFAQSILSSDDQLAQIALLASSRLTQTGLPVELVSPLLRSKNDLLSFAAERYLLSEDSKEARQALWLHHPNEAFITGWRETVQYLEETYAVMDELEKKLRAELLKDDGPTEIYALLTNNDAYRVILRVYNDKVVYTDHRDPSRYLERTVSKAELASIKDFIAQNAVEDSRPVFESCHHDCMSSEYLKLTKDRGRRVFSRSGFAGKWGLIWERFQQLSHGDNARMRYSLEKEIKGLEVLFADKNLKVQDVWTQDAEVRIFVEREETEAEQDERSKLYQREQEEEETEFARAERLRKVAATNKVRFSWRALANGRVDRITTHPQGYVTFDETRFSMLLEPSVRSQSYMQILSADTIILTRNFDGLWKQVANTKAVPLSTSGAYSNPIVTPGGTWVVAAKADEDWSAPNYVVRYNLRTGREFRVRLEPASQFNPVAFVPAHGKVLLRRAKEDYDPDNTSVGPNRPEYHLLDAETGATQLISGVFAPLHEDGNRSLQPTGNPNEFWAAISDEDKNQTQIGRYNVKDFSFRSTLTVPNLLFDSLSVWVDAKNEKVYVVYKDQLLRLPFKQD